MSSRQLAATAAVVAAAVTTDTLLTWANSFDHGPRVRTPKRLFRPSAWLSGPYRGHARFAPVPRGGDPE